MTTITQKKKLGNGTKALLIIAFIALIAVLVCIAIGILDASPVVNFVTGFYASASENAILAGIVTVGLPIFGAFIFWIVQRYFVGQKVTTTAGVTPGYSPAPTYPSTPAKSDTETKIS